MKKFKEEFKAKIKEEHQGRKRLELPCIDGQECDGQYEGRIINRKPNGIGRWIDDSRKERLEGEWRDGKLNGRVIVHHRYGREEFEAKDGVKNGKSISYMNDGNQIEEEFKKGLRHGLRREYKSDGTKVRESKFVDGVQIELII